ncbi:MAG: NAD(P)-dependent glycerol-3-phosphate dehydrogenase [Dehalococcoidales bacterium]|nr:NAD(P)-dependent glycerol-3-phosphate dehydrogenase [Dehalococcoidales bacterium]
MAAHIVVAGTGTWGTTLAVLLARKRLNVSLLARTATEASTLQADRENRRFLPGITFPNHLAVSSSPDQVLGNCSMLFLVVPSQTMRSNLGRLRSSLAPGTILVSASKGIESDGTDNIACRRMSEVIAEELPEEFGSRICVLSGPTLAREIAQNLPATAVVAARDEGLARVVQETLITPTFRVYTSGDVVGVELGGALKNIIALGAGMGDGLAVGDNAKAAFMTRGLAEIARLGVAAGANPLTFAGLAGLGDLVATCSSRLSRNRFVGEELARGRKLADIQASMHMVAEGVSTTRAARLLARKYGIEMPITELMYDVLFQDKDPRAAVAELMTREPKSELQGIEESMPSILQR